MTRFEEKEFFFVCLCKCASRGENAVVMCLIVDIYLNTPQTITNLRVFAYNYINQFLYIYIYIML